ncbi:MAG TPA: glycosyltransferase family 39 protein [Actinomycetes bacterium]|nr:glycosyltransferase family 39 protein [Actinomycetes bacterium]
MAAVLAVVAVVHAWGMTGAPQRGDDEGTYVSQAWAVQHWQTLAHYTYWYDHPPVGWILIAGYTAATRAFARAPNAVAAGREFIFVLQLVSCGLLYVLARRVGLRRAAAAAAVLLFSLSPLALTFHRAVYLDNIATPFLLAAFVLVLSPARRLAAHMGSGLCFGLAVLCKETSLLLLPALAWQFWRTADRRTRRYSAVLAGSLFLLTGSTYLLYALLRGELLPGPGHVSLFDGVWWQLFNRRVGGSLFDPTSYNHDTVVSWLQLDPWLLAAALVLAPVALAIRRLRPLTAGFLLLVAMITRPGYLPIPFVIGLLPFAALIVPAVADAAWGRPWRSLTLTTRVWSIAGRVAVSASLIAAVVAVGPQWRDKDRDLMLTDHDAPLAQAEQWIAANLPRNSRMVVDDAIWVDLVRRGHPPRHVVWFWKLGTDPEVDVYYPNGWRDFDYVVSTGAMRGSSNVIPELKTMLDHSRPLVSFGQYGEEIQILEVRPNG